MKIAVIVSRDCPAGNNVKNCLIELLDIHKDKMSKKREEDAINEIIKIDEDNAIYVIKEKHVYAENLDKEINADLFIFATTHKSKVGTPSLSVHAPGNWGSADLGGRDNEICVAPAFFLKEALITMEKINNTGFEVMQECTHHGPFMRKPCMFIEIGSDEKEWKNKEAGMTNAKVIIHLINDSEEIRNKGYKSAFGIGGLHHTPNFKKIIIDTEIAIGHVCPKYNLEKLNQEMIAQATERTFPKTESVIVDWKGLGGFKDKVKELLESNKLVYKKTKEF